MSRLVLPLLAALVLFSSPLYAADVTRPADIEDLLASRTGEDVSLTWGVVDTDATGNPETVDVYRVYRGLTADFVPDKDTASNRVAEVATASWLDTGAAAPGEPDYYYLVTAVDNVGIEGNSRDSTLVTPPVLSGNWTDTTIDLNWTGAEPPGELVAYRVYYGKQSGVYDFVEDVGLATSHSLTGLDLWVNWYVAVAAVDAAGNESLFSNEHVDAVAGRVRVLAHDDDKLCWTGGGQVCPPRTDTVQRSGGFQLNVPVDFPEGDWKRVLVTFTMDSKLCAMSGSSERCGGPPTWPSWNPCGDPWDRGAHLFLVLDDCIAGTGSCMTNANLELLRAITPFGTDAPPPEGTGAVPPRSLTLDVTPFAPLLAGTRHVGAHIGNFATNGWWVTTEFEFSERDDEASPKPPADGIEVLFFGGAEPPAHTVDVPATATQVVTRLFTTGHGGSPFCDGGSEDGNSCDTGCPGGTCGNCDEFCHRNNQILVDGGVAWETVPWQDCCFPRDAIECQVLGWGGPGCSEWNSCGFPSCTYPRAGWCPGMIACHYDLDQGCDQDLDLTSQFPPGGTYEVDYNITPRNGSWSVSLVMYWYE